MFAELDVSGWPPIDVEVLGTKPKQWLLQPDPAAGPGRGTEWLWKEATFNRRADGSTYPKGEDWAERVASAVGTELGVPVAQVELAVRRDTIGADVLGVVSRRMLTDRDGEPQNAETLVHGNELLADVGVVLATGRARDGYTWRAIRAALQDIEPPSIAATAVESGPHPVDVAVQALRSVEPAAVRHWTERVRSMASPDVLFHQLPPGRCSAVAAQFAAGVLERNRQRLLSQAGGTVRT
jgi:hypothetical protein